MQKSEQYDHLENKAGVGSLRDARHKLITNYVCVVDSDQRKYFFPIPNYDSGSNIPTTSSVHKPNIINDFGITTNHAF